MKKHCLHYFSFLLVLVSLVPSVRGDWINLTGAQSAPNIAEIYVEDAHIRLVLEIYVGDLDKFFEGVRDGTDTHSGPHKAVFQGNVSVSYRRQKMVTG